MSDTILIVDDDLQVVTGLQRSLYKRFAVEIAGGADDAIEAISGGDDYAVVVSDLQMPGMSGIEFLEKVKDLSPDSVRILLTGHADLDTAIAAVNSGNIFRFLTKPCPREVLCSTLETALERHRLLVGERQLLQETLMGTVEALMEVLGAMHPAAFGRARRLRQYVRYMALACHPVDLWQFEAAAMLAQLGCVSVSPATLERIYTGQELSSAEEAAMAHHPQVGKQLLAHIPRLEHVARMIECQNDEFVDRELPADEYSIRLGGQMLAVAIDFDRLLTLGATPSSALHEMRGLEIYDPSLLDIMAGFQASHPITPDGSPADPELAVYRPVANRVSRLLR
jgi:response regulator RpfG family c-di-GMP phosphodiesterase